MNAGNVGRFFEKIATLGRYPRKLRSGTIYQPDAGAAPVATGSNGPTFQGVGTAVGRDASGVSVDKYGLPVLPPAEGETVTQQHGPHAGASAFNGYDSEGNHVFTRDDGSGWWIDKKTGDFHSYQADSSFNPLQSGASVAAPAPVQPAAPAGGGFYAPNAVGPGRQLIQPPAATVSPSDYAGGAKVQLLPYTPGSVKPQILGNYQDENPISAGALMGLLSGLPGADFTGANRQNNDPYYTDRGLSGLVGPGSSQRVLPSAPPIEDVESQVRFL